MTIAGQPYRLQPALTWGRTTAQEALKIALINKVIPEAELMPTAEKIAEPISENSPIAETDSVWNSVEPAK